MTWLSHLWAWLREILSNDRGWLTTPDGKEIRWRRESLPISISVYRLSYEDARDVHAGCVWVNEQIGFECLIATGGYEADVIARYRNDADGPSENATTVLYWDENAIVTRGELLLPRTWPSREVKIPALRHELLHVPGLAHDPHRGSIMYHAVTGEGRLWKADIERLRRAYG